MKANPGGQIDLNEVIGRSQLIKQLWDTLDHQSIRMAAFDDREQLIKLLRLLEQDHYLSRNPDAHYHFQFPLLQRWWKLSRGL